MTFIPKPNTGTLWPNNRKSAPTHPDMRGDLFLDVNFLQDMISKADGGLAKISVSCWGKNINGQDCLSMSASEPYVKQESAGYRPAYKPAIKPAYKPAADDSDVPF